jgi:uncharacterized membrane protein YeaQ/YmgE (transglycosylase-associated protein family)
VNLKELESMGILWTILIGFIAGVLAKLITPGDNEPSGFILTTILGIVGAFVASFLGQALGWYNAGEGAGLIGATVGAIIVLLVWGAIAGRQRTFLKTVIECGGRPLAANHAHKFYPFHSPQEATRRSYGSNTADPFLARSFPKVSKIWARHAEMAIDQKLVDRSP